MTPTPPTQLPTNGIPMNNNWQTFLLENGAESNPSGLMVFDNETGSNKTTQENTVICDLSQYSTVVVAGEDAATFMQGQFTNDVNLVTENNSQLSAFCNNKGRMIANFRLFKHQNNYFINLHSSLVETAINHLQNYILRSQVVLQDVSEQLIHLGICGEQAATLLSTYVDTISDEIDSVSFNEQYIFIRAAGETPRYEIFCDIEHARQLWHDLSQQIKAVNSSSWDYLNIQAGIPCIDINTSETFVPQMANMELINGVSFNKGCFTGQEIVARMHYLGKLKKRCFKIHIATDTAPLAGDKLFAENARAGQNTGEIIMAAKNPESGYDALAVIQIADTESGLFLNDADGPVVTVKTLPYELNTNTEQK